MAKKAWATALVRVVVLCILLLPSTQNLWAAAPTKATGVMPSVPQDFHSYSSLAAELVGLGRNNSDILSIEDLGTSWENRSLFAARLRVVNNAKNVILFMGLHHADEWLSLEQVIYLLHYFLLNKDDPRVHAVLERADVWFIPLVNPDGYEYTRSQDGMWRKNRRDNGDGTFGVDLNRNYGYEWGSSNFGLDTNSSEYRGPAPFSEPETQAIRDFSLEHPPVLSISYHTAGKWILFPWSYTRDPSRDDGLFRGIAQEMAGANGYEILQEGHSSHLKAGNSDDWLYANFGTLAFTIELGRAHSSRDVNQIGAVVHNNVEPALRASELALHLRELNCALKQLACIPTLGIITLGVPGVAGSTFFALRAKQRRANHGQTGPLDENQRSKRRFLPSYLRKKKT